MKVLYLYCDATTSEGVISKVKAKINALAAAGVQVRGLFITPHIKEAAQDKNIRYVPFRVNPLGKFYYRRFIRNYFAYFNYHHYFSSLYKLMGYELKRESFDYIIFRYPLANKYLYNLTGKYKGKIIFEHNTKEPEELQSTGADKLLYENEVKFAPSVLQNARALIGVTSEIAAYEKGRSGKELPVTCVSNGIDITQYSERSAPPYDGKNLKLLMLCGSAVSWHGEDIVIKAMAAYNGPVNIEFLVVGDVLQSSKDLADALHLRKQVKFIPALKGKELDDIFNEAHLGMGTLALHRKGLREAAPLKVREYLAKGLACVISYKDAELMNSALSPFILKTEEEKEELDLNQVVTFANHIYSIDQHPAKIRNAAKDVIDVNAKALQLKNFITSLHAN